MPLLWHARFFRLRLRKLLASTRECAHLRCEGFGLRYDFMANRESKMGQMSIKPWTLVLLQLVAFVTAQRRGGGSSDSDSSSSGSDSSGSSSGGSSSRPKGTQHVEVSGNSWPYRWAGSYYNGSITLDTSIEYWPDCSERSRDTWRTSMDGILHLGPGNWTSASSFDDEQPQFLLMGWEDGKIPSNNWTDGEYWGNGGPGLTRWFSTDVKLMLSRFIQIWHDENTEYLSSADSHEWDHGWNVEANSAVNSTNEYTINGTWKGVCEIRSCLPFVIS